MIIFAPVSAGELIDRITILEIKMRRIADPVRRANVRQQLEALERVRASQLPDNDGLARYQAALSAVNEALWEIEDAVRQHEREQEFSARFVELARAISRHNDERAALKRAVDILVGSTLLEEKSYGQAAHDGGGRRDRD